MFRIIFVVNESKGFTVQGGFRYNYNNLNNELLISPRAGFSWKPANWKNDFVFRGAVGAYHQPPFYRELRRYDGSVNEDLKAQRSYQAVLGFDYNFKSGARPYRLTTEAYYKSMSQCCSIRYRQCKNKISGRK